jgi:hypothetical protein
MSKQPTQCTAELINKIADLTSLGMKLPEIGKTLGLFHNTIHIWIKKGKKISAWLKKEPEVLSKITDNQRAYWQLYLHVTRAEELFRSECHNRICNSKDWKAQVYLLSRFYGNEVYPYPTKEQPLKVEASTTINVAKLSIAERAYLLQALTQSQPMLPDIKGLKQLQPPIDVVAEEQEEEHEEELEEQEEQEDDDGEYDD